MEIIHCLPVPEVRRVDYTASLFGVDFSMRLEPVIFTMAERLSTDYHGGYWQFYALSNGAFYMAPDGDDAMFNVVCENGFVGKLSADALGITACLYAYSHLSFVEGDRLAVTCAEQYHLLREHAMDHAEMTAILGAMD